MDDTLPPLPAPHWPRGYHGSVPSGGYTADQVHAYARAALAARPAVPADMLPSAEHIKEIASELVNQAMEQAQVFASSWALVGSRFDAGNELDNAEQQKADLRTIIQSLADMTAETVRPIAAAPATPSPAQLVAAVPVPSHPEPQIMRWSDLEQRAIDDYRVAILRALGSE